MVLFLFLLNKIKIQNQKRFRSLSEIECYPQSKTDIRIPIFDKESAAFCFEKSRELLSKPFNLDLNLSSTNTVEQQQQPQSMKNKISHSSINNLNSNSNNNNSINNDCDHHIAVVGNLSKKARDFIGENLIDIENTLKALNLDFLQTFNELEKTDSAETLFGETYGYDSGMQNPKIRTSSIKLSSAKLSGGGGGGGGIDISTASPPKSAGRSIQCSPLAGGNFTNVMAQFYSDTADADKRSSTPDTGFASRETNASSSRRGSQKSSYSPQDNHFSPREFGYSIQDTRSYLHELTKNNRNVSSSSPIKMVTTMTSASSSGGGGGKLSQQNNTPPRKFDLIETMIELPNRQRSMSFTENYELKSPILAGESQQHPHQKYGSSGSHISSSKKSPCNNQQQQSVSYKPKSIRARNLRRLSYNPVVLDSSSSSSSETEFDRSIAHSECDIRSSMLVTRRRRQYLNRKSSVSTIGHDKLYGSNASIKSAPQYNYDHNDRQVKSYLHQKFNYNYNNCDGVDDSSAIMYPFDVGGGVGSQQKLYRNDTKTGSGGNIIHTPPPPPPPPPRGFDLEPLQQSFNRNILYSEFDVSKLTGKSPTTQSFLQELFPEPIKSKSINIVAQSTPPQSSAVNNANVAATATKPPNVFQWPEKIHASAVIQNDMLWRQHNAKAAAAAAAAAASIVHSYSSDSSSTETDAVDFGVDFVGQRMPPSPAP